MMIMIMKTSGSQVDSPVAEGKRTEGGGRKIRKDGEREVYSEEGTGTSEKCTPKNFCSNLKVKHTFCSKTYLLR